MDNTFLPFSRPSIGDAEVAAVEEVLRSGWITTGPRAQALETRFAERFGGDGAEAIAVSSATGGMHVTLLAMGIGPGDEVITPSLTWVSTVNLICLLGAKPVFVDVDPDTLMATPDHYADAITPRTRAMIPVHYAGAPADLDGLYALADKHGIALIEDAAHAAGTDYKGAPVGSRGTSVFSFHAIKNMTCAEGGLVLTHDPALAGKIRMLKFHGLGVDAFDRQSQGRAPQAEVLEPGFKYNLPDISAAIALVQLDRLDALNARRTELANRYRQKLADSPVAPLGLPEYPHTHAWHLMVVRVAPEHCGMTREVFMGALKDRNIGTGIHFRAAHTQRYYQEHFPDVRLPVTERNSAQICSLPLFPDMRDADVDRVVAAVNDIFEAAKKNQ